ncbi:helix-turn-helix transcriptional regulator [Streptomyces sp. NPDC006638]|uniref:helix-turn-helix transcriptional regulator n=1 Tax=Streptomyces sp. NPDC006638 TaxID=3157183 RepID=UPI0033B4D57A
MESDKAGQGGPPAEEVFIAQMKHRRAVLGLTQTELAERVAAVGGSMYQQTIAKLESGHRGLKLSEADFLAKALGSTVQEMLSLTYEGPSKLRHHDSRNVAELQKESNRLLAELHQAEQAERDAEERRAAAEAAVTAASREYAFSEAILRSAKEARAVMADRYQRVVAQLHHWREVEREQES